LSPLVLVSALVGPAASAQMEQLYRNDDQFIQGLREAGMSELLGRFVEQVDERGGLEPIAQRQLQVALYEFAASDSFQRAVAQNGVDPERAQALFLESRASYEQMLGEQQKLIDENPQDERVPMWQTDLAAMLLDTYLPTYFNNASWFYDFGVPTPEQAEAFERSAVQALGLAADARFRIESLTSRLGADGGELRARLEEMNIFFDLRQEYGQRRTPYWFAHAAYYVAMLPDTHAYYRTLGNNPAMRNQARTPADERLRLLEQAEGVAAGNLQNDPGVGLSIKLLGGRALVRMDDPDRVDEGVDAYLDPVITGASDSWQGFLASLAKARGREAVGELDTATEILEGMAKHTFVTQQLASGNAYPRLIVADLLHRLLLRPAEGARGADRMALLAEAYEKPYLPLVNNDPANFFGPFLYRRWAEQVDPAEDPAVLPPMVRMGVGQMMTERGSVPSNELIYLANNAPLESIAIPAEREREERRRAGLLEQARGDLATAVRFNQTLTDEAIDAPVRARGLMSLGFAKYYLAELAKYYGGEGGDSIAPYFEVAQLWARIGIELPDTEQAEQATGFAVTLLQQFDQLTNTGPAGVTNSDYRDAYRAAIDVMYRYWPSNDTAHALRVYTGFFVYELSGDLEQAIAVYEGMPQGHPDYFEARRQMVLAMQKVYDNLSDELRRKEMTGASEDTEVARENLEQELGRLREEQERMRRELLNVAELLMIDADDEAEHGREPRRRFSAATARGGALVAIAAMESDGGDAEAALDLLDGFEIDYNPEGPLAGLVQAQPDPAKAREQLDGLIQSAQERRILALVAGGQLDRIGDEARSMIASYPDVAAGVVNGVLKRIEEQIQNYEQVRDKALLPINRQDAEQQITRLAGVATQLSELLVTWAKNQGYTGSRLLPFELGLAKALLLANRPGDAVPLMDAWLEEFPNNFDVVLLTADCRIAAARKTGDRSVETISPALDLYYKIILYYNSQPGEKPRRFWEAWLKALQTLDYVGGNPAREIPDKVRMLENRVSEDLGGPDFKPRFQELYNRHLN
jgi:hypothetical protein